MERWEWFTLDNRLLWVFRQLEKKGKITYIQMRRVEYITKTADLPNKIYDFVHVVDKEIEEPVFHIPAAVKSGKKGKDVRLLSKKLRRFHLEKAAAEKAAIIKEKEDSQRRMICNKLMKLIVPKDEPADSKSEVIENSVLDKETDLLKGKKKSEDAKSEKLVSEKGALQEDSKIIIPAEECSVVPEASNNLPEANLQEERMEDQKGSVGDQESSPKQQDEVHVAQGQNAPLEEVSSTPENEILLKEAWVVKSKETAVERNDPVLKDEEKELINSESTFEIIVKDEDTPGDVMDVGGPEEMPRCARESSVCSSVSEIPCLDDDWGRKDVTSPVTKVNEEEPSDEEWIEIESIVVCDQDDDIGHDDVVECHINENDVFKDENSNIDDTTSNTKQECPDEKKSTVLAWIQGRKKFCNRYAKNTAFQEYVAHNVNPKPEKRRSLSQSLISLDSAFSSTSALSLSSITREQRHIDLFSGFYGYGNFDKYNTEYLSKLRAERLASKRKWKPYDVASSMGSGRRRRASSMDIDDRDWRGSTRSGRSLRSSRRSVTVTEETVTRRTYSESVEYHNSRSLGARSRGYDRSISAHESDSSRSWYHHDTERCVTRSRRFSESDERRGGGAPSRFLSHYGERDGPRRRSSTFHGSSSSVGSSKSLVKRGNSFQQMLKKSSMPKERLYKLWQCRREEYMKARYESSLALAPHRSCTSLAVTGYTCGLCFKSFPSRIRREQHSEELMHWACVTCGRFFASHTALGQHVEEVGHRKD